MCPLPEQFWAKRKGKECLQRTKQVKKKKLSVQVIILQSWRREWMPGFAIFLERDFKQKFPLGCARALAGHFL